ncbi:uncharacterized protein [Medicago truncatula]|uniref:uncharacterized protein n=1 Tax=Medicago truncatula TaxID=3880 RepID=UPI001967B596|nr:uncharacterized protein LOC112419420 [Medicago truncatula]
MSSSKPSLSNLYLLEHRSVCRYTPLIHSKKHSDAFYHHLNHRIQSTDDHLLISSYPPKARKSSHDGTTDPGKHIKNIEKFLTYRSVQGVVKCKLFVTTLRRGDVTWFKHLRRNSIESWSDLCYDFTTHFTSSRTQPKTVASLEAIVQGKSEPLRDYIERFNKEVVQVRGADETMKQYLIAKGLRAGTDVKKVVSLDRPWTLNEFLEIAKIYIAYEEELYADSLNKSRKEEPAAESSKNPFHEKKREGKATREGKRPNGHFTEYTPLAMSREKILAEIAVADLTEVGVKTPKASSQERKGVGYLYVGFTFA